MVTAFSIELRIGSGETGPEGCKESELAAAVTGRHLPDQPQGAFRIELEPEDREKAFQRSLRLAPVRQDLPRVLSKQPCTRLFKIKPGNGQQLGFRPKLAAEECARARERL